MPMLEAELNQKKKVRVPQRAAAAKMIIQLKELCHETNPDIPWLVQRKSSLLVKGEIIKRLDGEVLDAVPEHELKAEVEWANEV